MTQPTSATIWYDSDAQSTRVSARSTNTPSASWRQAWASNMIFDKLGYLPVRGGTGARGDGKMRGTVGRKDERDGGGREGSGGVS